MGRYSIACPSCGRYAQVRTGLFAKKRVTCECGHVIDVPMNKLVSLECEHCHNTVLVDANLDGATRCPVCHKPINRVKDKRVIEFACEQCGVLLCAPRKAETYKCPVCDHMNHVKTQIMKEEISLDGLASIIKYEGNNETLVWKHPVEDFNMGTQLIVHESQEAIFFRDGQALDLFGAGRYTLEPQQIPMLEKIYVLPTSTEGTFHSEVYFFNMTTQMGIKWGTDSKVRLFDPASGLHVELGARGEFSIRIHNARKLLVKLVGTTLGLDHEQLMGGNGKGLFRTLVMTQVKTFLAQTIKERGISVLEIDERLEELSEGLRERINVKLDEYGLTMPEFFVKDILLPEEDANFRKYKEQFAERSLGVRQEKIRLDIAQAEAERKVFEAQAAVQMKKIGAQGDADLLNIKTQAEAEAARVKAMAEADAYRAKAMAEAEAYRAQAMAEAAEMRAKGYTYQQETSRQVGMQAMQNGVGGGNGGSGLGGGLAGTIGEVAGLGMTLGAMGGVMNMTREAMAPMMEGVASMTQQASMIGQAAAAPVSQGTWACAACGQQGITTNFCPNCGAKKPAPVAQDAWVCAACGQQGITMNFCPNCGARKPAAPETWDCTGCGQSGITTNFCPNCGARKPNPTWICPDCGQQGIKTNFCPNCGRAKGV